MPQLIYLISILRLVVIVFVHCGCSDSCLGDTTTYGSMTEDHELRVGSPIELTCSLKNHIIIDEKGEIHNVSASDLTFKYSNNSYVDAETIKVISPLQSRMRIESSKVEDSGLYYCVLNLGNKWSIVCNSHVIIGYEPQKASINFTCISNYQELECRWETEPSKLKTVSTVKENVYYKLTIMEMYKKCAIPCSPSNNNMWCCKWTLSTVPKYDNSKIVFEFIVETNNSLGKKSDRHHVNHYEIVLPPKPQQLVGHTTQNWIQLNWLSPKGMDNFAPGLLYQIMYKPQQKVNWKVINITVNARNISYNITDLIPNTLYLITLRCRSPYSKGENMWSKNETLQIRTKPDVPYFAPNTTQQAFEIRQTQYSRTIVIHWEHVPEEFWNGENFHYIISHHPVRTKTEELTSYSIIKNTTMPYATFRDLDSNSSYHFKIFSANSNGVSRNYSSITVDSSEKLPLAPEDITVISLSGGHYNISWKPPRIDSHLIKNYTLFWCNQLRPRPFLCEGSIHWKHVTKTNIELNIPDERTNFQFAVAANSEDSSSGMEWALCVVPFYGAPAKLRDFSVIGENSTTLHVTWKLDCIAQKAIIKEFSVYYCKADEQEESSCVGGYEINKITNNSADNHYIINLVPFTRYHIYIEILAVDGQKVDSEYKHKRTLPGAPSDCPRDLKILNATNSSIEVSWKPPQHPNGIITRYVVLYNDIEDYLDVIDYNKIAYSKVVETNIVPFTNYSIQLKACVNTECSPSTNPVYVITDIGIPGEMDEPRAEAVNTSFVTVSWNAPSCPNGPISYYLLYLQPIKDYNTTVKDVPYRMINITGNVTSALVNVDCPIIGKGIKYSFRLQPVNELDNKQLFGPKSDPTTALACLLYPDGFSSEMIVSIIVGSAVGCAILLFIIYMFIRWMKKKYDLLRKIKVKLPTGLDTPNRGTPGTYQDFKKDLLLSYPSVPQIKQNSGGAFVVDIKKNRHGSGHSQYSTISADELLIKKSIRCDTYRRNPSGDSSSGCSSTGGHDSISSSNTHQTHVSTDSGTEFDFLHISGKDNVFPEQASTHKHSIFVIPDLDSSPEKDELNETLKKPASSATKNVPLLSPVCLQPYCKFGLNQVKDSYSNHCPRQWNMLTYVSNLANSEPSVAELDPGNSNSSLMPYSKLAFSKSLENLHETNVDYLKYGTIDDSVICGFENTVKLPCYTAINVYQQDRETRNTNPLPSKGYVSIQTFLERKKMPDCNKLQSLNQNVNNASSNICDSMAYSKFDIKPVSVDMMENPKTAAGYIPFQQANCMLQTVDLSSCSPFDGSIGKELCVGDVVLSAIIEPCAVNKLNVPDECYNFHLYKSHSQSQEDIAATGGNDGTEVDKNHNNTALNKQESMKHSCVSGDAHPQTIDKCKDEETKTNEQNSVSNNYLNGLEVVMSPSNLNCATTSLPACRSYSQSDEMGTINSKNGYVHISPVYYV